MKHQVVAIAAAAPSWVGTVRRAVAVAVAAADPLLVAVAHAWLAAAADPSTGSVVEAAASAVVDPSWVGSVHDKAAAVDPLVIAADDPSWVVDFPSWFVVVEVDLDLVEIEIVVVAVAVAGVADSRIPKKTIVDPETLLAWDAPNESHHHPAAAV